jgi:hypothetical protein
MSDENEVVPEAGAEKVPEVKVDAKSKKAKVLPKITRKFINRDTGVMMTVVSDPNTDTHVETTTVNGKETITKHAGISHAWARLDEILEPKAK